MSYFREHIIPTNAQNMLSGEALLKVNINIPTTHTLSVRGDCVLNEYGIQRSVRNVCAVGIHELKIVDNPVYNCV
jgi:hypothetical protein